MFFARVLCAHSFRINFHFRCGLMLPLCARMCLHFYGQADHVLKARNINACSWIRTTKQCGVNAHIQTDPSKSAGNLLTKCYNPTTCCVCVSLLLNERSNTFLIQWRKAAKINTVVCIPYVMNLIMRFESEILARTHKRNDKHTHKQTQCKIHKCNEPNVVWWIESVITNKICISFSVELFVYDNKKTHRKGKT